MINGGVKLSEEEKYKIIRLSDVKTVERMNEIIYEITKGNSKFSVALAEIKGENKAHYHTYTTEIYHVTKGKCSVILDGKKVDLNEGDTIIIYPKTTHQVISDYVKVLVIATPPYSPEDYFEIKK